MAKTKKRILSLAMALVMVFTLLPVNALADNTDTISVTIYTGTPVKEDKKIYYNDIKGTSHICFPRYRYGLFIVYKGCSPLYGTK